MNKTRMSYFVNDDILHLSISDDSEKGSVEVSPFPLLLPIAFQGRRFEIDPPSREMLRLLSDQNASRILR